MSVLSYKCPACGGPLAFSGEEGKLSCSSCSSVYEVDALEALAKQADKDDIQFSMSSQEFGAADAGQILAFSCQFCGAELVTDANTSATECAYCGSSAIMTHQLESGAKPEKVVPFKVTQQQAKTMFDEYFSGKRLLPNIFLESRNRVAEMRKLYVPYWLFSCEVDADITFDAEEDETTRDAKGNETRKTIKYEVRRAGTLAFDDIPVDGSTFMDDKITEALEPFDYRDAIPFQPGVLAGAMADNADVEAQVCQERATVRVKRSTEQIFRGTTKGYDRISVRTSRINTKHGKATNVLLPVWLITTEKVESGEKKTYTFAINGQTGKLTCNVLPDKRKSMKWFWGLFLGCSVVGYLILLALTMLEVIS